MRSEPNWLPFERVLAICRKVVTETNEPFLLHSADRLHGALGRPINHWQYGDESDIVTLAAVLLLGIAKNHPFEQGNKRTALLSALVFLEINGYRFDIDDPPILADLIRRAIVGHVSQSDFVRILRTFIVPQ